MSLQFMGLITVMAGLIVLMAPVTWAFMVMVLSTVFGAAAAISLPMLGGASVLVPSLFLAFFGLRLFMAFGEGPILGALVFPGPGFWLLILTSFGLLTAFSFPGLFKGATETMTVERIAATHSFISLTPLRFSSNNITQSVYAIGGLAAFAGTFAYFRRSGTPDLFVNAIIAVSILNLAFALVDVVSYFTHTEYILSFVRTANYALLTDAEKGGFKRISGSFPEASAFSDYSLLLFATVASLWLDRVRRQTTGIVAMLLLVALLLSTSATALVGIGIILPLLWLRSLNTTLTDRDGGRPTFLLASLALVPLVALTVFVLFPGVTDGLGKYLNEVVLSKAGSQSGRERFMWNAMAYKTFLDTSGFGAGLGSARASSFILVLLSNVGVIGFSLFMIFVVSIMRSGFRRKDDATKKIQVSSVRAAKIGVLAVLTSSIISGTVYDLGLMFYILAGAAAAFTVPQSVKIAGLAIATGPAVPLSRSNAQERTL